MDTMKHFTNNVANIRQEMGGADRIEKIHARGEKTIREHFDALLDPSSFHEIGTFARSMRLEDRDRTPGDGKIGGHGNIHGKPVTVCGDDITVKYGSASIVGIRKAYRLFDRSVSMGIPFVYFAASSGGRVPDTIGSEGISEPGPLFTFAKRRHRIPMATAVLSNSFGGSSFLSALSDFVVMKRGACLAVSSPKVFELAIGEKVGFEEVGGTQVHEDITGQIDLAVETDEEAYAAIRRWLSYFPPNAHTSVPRVGSPQVITPDEGIGQLVPERRSRAYDMRMVIRRICDEDSVFEIKPKFARNVICAFARINGHVVGVVANNPMFDAGALTPKACKKIIRMMVQCDAYNIPLVNLVDVPGFFVGKKVEHEQVLQWSMRLMQALQYASMPTMTVCIRKAFGAAWQAMNGSMMPANSVYAWPGAEIGLMDPKIGVKIAYGSALDRIEDEEARTAESEDRLKSIAEQTSPYPAAGTMRIDEIIDPADTRMVLAADLERFAHRRVPSPQERVLSTWPTC